MSKKEIIIASFLLLLAAITLSGCKEEQIICAPPLTVINSTCCMDINNDTVCDEGSIIEFATLPEKGCGDNTCDADENCTTCWKDCGACKRIVYVYVARNFTLGELVADINELPNTEVKFRKDIDALNDVSNFFIYRRVMDKYIADFMDTPYKERGEYRDMVLNHITNDNYFINDSRSLIHYLNFSNWYIIHRPRSTELKRYETRILEGRAVDDYPTQPTGYLKEQMYDDWEYRNYTQQETVLYEHVKLLPGHEDIVESIYLSITRYLITYKSGEFSEPDEPEFVLEDFDRVEENRLTNIHAFSFQCGNNLVITIYNHEFEPIYFGINEENVEEQLKKNRESLLKRANSIKAICDKEFKGEVFTYT